MQQFSGYKSTDDCRALIISPSRREDYDKITGQSVDHAFGGQYLFIENVVFVFIPHWRPSAAFR
jgi:hypothetical protein